MSQTNSDHWVNQLSAILKRYNLEFHQGKDNIKKSLLKAESIGDLRRLFHEEPKSRFILATLQDSPHGFFTDRCPSNLVRNQNIKPYSYQVIMDSCIDALLSGYRLFGGDFIIRNSKVYPTCKGLHYRIINSPDVDSFHQQIKRLPKQTGNPIQILCQAVWRKKGADQWLNPNRKPMILNLNRSTTNQENNIYHKALQKTLSLVISRLENEITNEIIWSEFIDNVPLECCLFSSKVENKSEKNQSRKTKKTGFKIKAGKDLICFPNKKSIVDHPDIPGLQIRDND